MLKKLLICCFVLMFVTPVCLAAELDAPVQKQVTVRSEIQKGFELVCNSTVNQFNPVDTDAAINNLLKRAHLNNMDTDAFLLGAYYSACYQIELAQDYKGNTKNQLDAGKVAFSFYYKKFREKQETLQISDQQLADAVGIKYEILKNDLVRWDSQIGGMATSQ